MSRKIIALVVVSLFLFGSVYSESSDKRIIVERITDADDDYTMNVPGTATLYTKSFSLKTTDDMAVMFQATSDTTVANISIYLQQSYARPDAEGTFQFEYFDSNTIVSSRTDYRWGCSTLNTLAPLPFGRFKIVGETGNPTDAVVQMKLGKQ